MWTRIRIDDDQLVRQAMELGGHRTKNEAAAEALKEYIRYRKRDAIRDASDATDLHQARPTRPKQPRV